MNNPERGIASVLMLAAIATVLIAGGILGWAYYQGKQETVTPGVPPASPTTTKQNYKIAYLFYDKNTDAYEVHVVDLADNTKKVIYPKDGGKITTSAIPAKYNENLIALSEGIGETVLLDLDGNLVSDEFVPPNTLFRLSPDGKKILYHSFLPPTGIVTITVKNLPFGEERFINPHGEGYSSECFNGKWTADSTAIYCFLSSGNFGWVKINPDTGEFEKQNFLAESGSLYPEDNKLFVTEGSPAVGDIVPPGTLSVVDLVTNKKTTLLKSDDSLFYGGIDLLHNRQQILFSLESGVYKADLSDVAGTMKKLFPQARHISVSDDGVNIIYSGNGGVFVSDIYGSEPIKLFEDTDDVKISRFIGWFKK